MQSSGCLKEGYRMITSEEIHASSDRSCCMSFRCSKFGFCVSFGTTSLSVLCSAIGSMPSWFSIAPVVACLIGFLGSTSDFRNYVCYHQNANSPRQLLHFRIDFCKTFFIFLYHLRSFLIRTSSRLDPIDIACVVIGKWNFRSL